MLNLRAMAWRSFLDRARARTQTGHRIGGFDIFAVAHRLTTHANRHGIEMRHQQPPRADGCGAPDRVADGGGPGLRLLAAAPQVRYVGPDTASTGPGEASVVASPGEWAAAVQARPGACFYIRLTDTGNVTYGVGAGCRRLPPYSSSCPAAAFIWHSTRIPRKMWPTQFWFQ